VNIAKTGANTNPNPVDEDGAGVAEDEEVVLVVAEEVALVAEVLVLVVPVDVAEVAVVADVAVVEVAEVAEVADVAVVAEDDDDDDDDEEEAAQDPEGFLLKVAEYLEQVDLEEHIPVVLILQLPVKYELQLVSTASQRLWQGL